MGLLPALGYFVLLIAFGDVLARRLLGVRNGPQRLATAFLVGLVFATWLSYLASFAFLSAEQPLIPGDLIAAAVMLEVVLIDRVGPWLLRRRAAAGRRLPGGAEPSVEPAMVDTALVVEPPPSGAAGGRGSRVARLASPLLRIPASERWDWLLLGATTALVGVLMYSSYRFSDGHLWTSNFVFSDFGPTTAISQSFAVGHNFPTEYPHFAGVPIIYHFMYWFEIGNLTMLGFDPGSASNLLSVASVVALLALVIALGRTVFGSAAVGRLGAALFFFHGTLNLVPFLASFATLPDALRAIPGLDNYLPSIFPYRGDTWGIWTQNVFLNQRHLASGIGVLLIVLLFVVDRLPRARIRTTDGDPADGPVAEPSVPALEPTRRQEIWRRIRARGLAGYVLCGALMGLLPMWNGSVFIACAAIFGVLLLLLRNRPQMVVMGLTATAFALPQLIALRPSELSSSLFAPSFHWGYIIEDPTLSNVAAYLGFAFGMKLVLAAVAVILGTTLQRQLFLAASSLVAVAFLIQFSPEVLANHKFLNIWLVILNVYAAFGLVRLWSLAGQGIAAAARRLVGRLVAVALTVTIAAGGLIDFVPLTHATMYSATLAGDQLYDWIVRQTRRTDVFLTATYVTHPILVAGRRIFFGYPYFTWGAGYPTAAREVTYRRLFSERDPDTLLNMLRQNDIAYVAIDDGLRQELGAELNEAVYLEHFEAAFVDSQHGYGNLAIYRVSPGAPSQPSTGSGVDMFTGGEGSGPGQLSEPRGLAVGPSGEVLIADTGNDRIQRFGADGAYLGAFGERGTGPGQFAEPNGVAIDSRGHVFVADTNNARIQEFDAADQFVREWSAAALGLYGPRDLAVGPDDTLYVLDQGHARVVRIAPDDTVTTFGSFGTGSGQLNDPTGIDVSGDLVFVADARNGRIVVFDARGRLIRSQTVPEWQVSPFQFPDVVASPTEDRLYASSSETGEVLVFNFELTRLGNLGPPETGAYERPSAMDLAANGALYVIEYAAARVSQLTPPPAQ
ncbi:MAG: NHL repeat-containing protein [Chloroflexota bacterium]